MENLKKHTEVECKYRIEETDLFKIKLHMEKIENLVKFTYVDGPDSYYINKDGDFLRYRKPNNSEDGRAELTMKKKMKDAKDNVIRREWNIRVDHTPEETITDMIENLGFSFNFKIFKVCHIYKYADATLVFYTVADITDSTAKKIDHFVEIEVDEDTIHEKTEEQAWEVIKKYETILAAVGISAQKRMKKSLFELYRK
jgi:adenylate cyclase class IV